MLFKDKGNYDPNIWKLPQTFLISLHRARWPKVGAGFNNEECDYYTCAIWSRGNTTCNNSEKNVCDGANFNSEATLLISRRDR